MNGAAALGAAPDLARVLLCAAAGSAATAGGRIMSAVWQRPCCFQYRPHSLLKPGPGCGRRHLPDQAYAPGNTLRTWAPCARQHSSTKLRGFGAVEPPWPAPDQLCTRTWLSPALRLRARL